MIFIMPYTVYNIKTRKPMTKAVAMRNYVAGRKVVFSKSTRTRRIKKSGVGISKSINFMPNPPFLPVGKWGKLPFYVNSNIVTATALTSNAYVLTANGLWKPSASDATNTNQPMTFDQMMQFYEHYTVTNCKITVNFYSNDVDDAYVVGILVAPDATPISDIRRLNENGMLIKRNIGKNDGSGRNQVTLSMSVNISKVNGKKSIVADNLFRGDGSSNPLEQSYIHLFAYNYQSNNTVTCLFEATLEYTAKFTEPRKLTVS